MYVSKIHIIYLCLNLKKLNISIPVRIDIKKTQKLTCNRFLVDIFLQRNATLLQEIKTSEENENKQNISRITTSKVSNLKQDKSSLKSIN